MNASRQRLMKCCVTSSHYSTDAASKEGTGEQVFLCLSFHMLMFSLLWVFVLKYYQPTPFVSRLKYLRLWMNVLEKYFSYWGMYLLKRRDTVSVCYKLLASEIVTQKLIWCIYIYPYMCAHTGVTTTFITQVCLRSLLILVKSLQKPESYLFFQKAGPKIVL